MSKEVGLETHQPEAALRRIPVPEDVARYVPEEKPSCIARP
jgi:hypothetical protein